MNKILSLYMLLGALLCACGSPKKKATAQPILSIRNIIAVFPSEQLTEADPPMTNKEWKQLMEQGSSPGWTLSVDSAQHVVIQNKNVAMNRIGFTAYSINDTAVVVGVQQQYAQSNVTELYLYQPHNPDSVWQSYALPSNLFQDFIADSVNIPYDFKDQQVTETNYLDITLSPRGLHYAINSWRFIRELETNFQNESGLEESYLKYQWDWLWNGAEFVAHRTVVPDYSPVLESNAREDIAHADGPGITEFDCEHGVSVMASAELPSADNRYSAQHLLDSKDETAWAVSHGGIGASVTFTVTSNFHIGDAWHIRTGYIKNKMLWQANNRVKKMKVYLNNKVIAHVTLRDSPVHQLFWITTTWSPFYMRFIQGDQIRFEIEEIYKGEKYDDTLISYFVPIGNCG